MSGSNGTAPTLSLHKKLAKVMAEAERIPKNGTAPQAMGGFKFVQVGDAADAIRKALAAQNISMIPSEIELIGESEHTTSGGKAMTTMTVRTTWTLSDGDSGETAQIMSIGAGADTGDKAAPKAQSSAMKYALLMGFLLSTGDDPEQTDTSDRQARQPTQRTEVYSANNPPPPRAVASAPNERTFTGKAVKWNQAGIDAELRLDPEGIGQYGFVLECEDGKKRHVRLTGDLAAAAAVTNPIDETVTVTGPYRVEDMTKKDGGTYKAGVIYATQIQTVDYTLPAPTLDAEAERELDAIAI